MKKFTINYLALCDEAFLSLNHKVNLIGIFDNITINSLPTTHVKSILVGNFDLHDPKIDKVEIRIDLLNNEDKTVGLNLIPVNLNVPPYNGKTRKLGFIYEIINLKIEQKGMHKFVIYANNEKLAEYSLEIILAN